MLLSQTLKKFALFWGFFFFFAQAYSNLLRAHMDGLKKKDKKSKSKKTKATQWFKKKISRREREELFIQKDHLQWPPVLTCVLTSTTFPSRCCCVALYSHRRSGGRFLCPNIILTSSLFETVRLVEILLQSSGIIWWCHIYIFFLVNF